jgi:ribosome maturation protein SDO1
MSIPQTALIEPGSFRMIDDLLQTELKGKGKIETLSFAAVVGETSD